MGKIGGLIILGAVTGFCAYFGNVFWRGTTPSRVIQRHNPILNEQVKRHTEELLSPPEVVKVTDGVYVAIGFGLANSILLEGPESAVVVDVMESYEAGVNVVRAFRHVTDRPITALILTHHHTDHVNGGQAFIEEAGQPIDVWAHGDPTKITERMSGRVPDVMYTRGMRQFGVYVDDGLGGIGPKLRFGTANYTSGMVAPTHFVSDIDQDLTISGISLKILHIPGETADQIGIWLPHKRVFLCADDLYNAFPNLYAIRGTMSRDVMEWVSSLDKIIELQPEFLVPSHTKPVTGVDKIKELMTVYRDAIQYVHDQTVRYINEGLHPHDIAQQVVLPENIASHPYLSEFYGTVSWSSKGIFSSYLGWFSGTPMDLSPLTLSEKSQRMSILLGGVDAMTQHAETALNEKDYKWSLELSTYAMKSDAANQKAKKIKIDSMLSLAELETSMCGRNYYLTSAYEEMSGVPIVMPPEVRQTSIDHSSMDLLMTSFSTRFAPETCQYKSVSVVFHFTDISTYFTIQVRNYVAIVSNKKQPKWDIKVETTSDVLREILKYKIKSIVALTTGKLKVDGGLLNLRNFLKCFISP